MTHQVEDIHMLMKDVKVEDKKEHLVCCVVKKRLLQEIVRKNKLVFCLARA